MRKNQELTFGKTPARRPRSNGHTVKELLIFKPEDLKYAILIYRRPGRSYHVFPGLAVSQCGIHPCRSQKPVRPSSRYIVFGDSGRRAAREVWALCAPAEATVPAAATEAVFRKSLRSMKGSSQRSSAHTDAGENAGTPVRPVRL
jgi:hypothetical protein